jgi:hypothetical protein
MSPTVWLKDCASRKSGAYLSVVPDMFCKCGHMREQGGLARTGCAPEEEEKTKKGVVGVDLKINRLRPSVVLHVELVNSANKGIHRRAGAHEYGRVGSGAPHCHFRVDGAFRGSLDGSVIKALLDASLGVNRIHAGIVRLVVPRLACVLLVSIALATTATPTWAPNQASVPSALAPYSSRYGSYWPPRKSVEQFTNTRGVALPLCQSSFPNQKPRRFIGAPYSTDEVLSAITLVYVTRGVGCVLSGIIVWVHTTHWISSNHLCPTSLHTDHPSETTGTAWCH